jgi:tRNA pseudouridine38-40 synthase
MAVRNIKLTIAYDGTDYHGWQGQPGMKTVQGTLHDALLRLTSQSVRVNGSSRTDAGVHALGQVANFHIDCAVPTENMAKALSRLLPDDITVAEAVEVAEGFDAISDTRGKLYRYMIYTGDIRPVMDIRYCWHRQGRLDIDAMKAAAGLFAGTKDFKSFAGAADQRLDSVRTVSRCEITKEESWIYVDVAGDGFLYNMVRNIVGTLVEVGRGRWKPAIISEILAAKDRSAAGPTAPASGLCLMRIWY